MKNLILFLILAMTIGGCMVNSQNKPRMFQVTVLDAQTNRPVDSALVKLVAMVDARDVYETTLYTDQHGKCRFKVTYPPTAEYQVRASKDGTVAYFDPLAAGADRAGAFVTPQTGNALTLLLTSDLMNHENFWAATTPRYEIKTLITLLQTNQFPMRTGIPLLTWEDIPELLAAGGNTQMIDRYPISPLSSGYSSQCPAGIVALWFVESVRIATLHKTLDPAVRFPNLRPLLREAGSNADALKANTVEFMGKAFEAYKAWWEEAQNSGKEQACKINPLANTGLEW
jgi:hypothetical protein